MSGYVQTNQPLLLPDAAANISLVDTGKIFLVNTVTGNRTYTLPAATVGIHYRFINMAAGALGGTVSITGPAGTLYGSAVMGPTGGVALLPISGSTTINFLTAVSLKGDTIDLYSDGVNYYITAFSRIAGAFTVA
jgi:hypothetical protein